MDTLMRTLDSFALTTMVALSASAQTGTFAGTVARDTAGGVVSRAEVLLPQLNRVTVSNVAGQFEFANVPAGRYAVVVRALGFQLFADSVDVTPGGRVDGDIALTPSPVNLEAQRTTATAVKKPLLYGMQEMEDRRKFNIGGYFVTDSELRKNDEKKLSYFFSRIPSLRLVPIGFRLILANTRTNCSPSVFIDGAPFYLPPPTTAVVQLKTKPNGAPPPPSTGEPPDLNSLPTAIEFSGIEYYPGAASAPPQYNSTSTGDCGIVLLWTRRTP